MKRVWVIEDDAAIRESIVEILESEGYPSRGMNDGEIALETLKTAGDDELPDLIILDMMMPRMDGWTFRAEQLRHARLSPIPVVIISADGQAGERFEGLQGAPIVRKPIILEDLLEVVSRSTQPERDNPR